MSYPPPPGLNSSTRQPPVSLPARPPPSVVNPTPTFKPSSISSAGKSAFTSFAPRSVSSANAYRTSSPAHYSAAPVTSYSTATQYSQTQQDSTYQSSQQHEGSSYNAPQIRNPFVQTSDSSTNPYDPPSNYDPDYEAQVQQWQSAYVNKDGERIIRRDVPPSTVTNTPTVVNNSRVEASSPAVQTDSASKTVQRSGGGTNWTDSSLLEWDPAHFRIFVGNLAGEVTDESLLKAFSKYPSVQKARVIRDKRTSKSKGYGFVSFSDGDDYFQAAREMQGKYIGSHPVLLKRSTTEVRPTAVGQKGGGKHGKNGNYNNKGRNGNGIGSGKADHYGGIQKKHSKTKGGLKVLG